MIRAWFKPYNLGSAAVDAQRVSKYAPKTVLVEPLQNLVEIFVVHLLGLGHSAILQQQPQPKTDIIHLFIKFASQLKTEFEIQLTKQASLNLEKENLPPGTASDEGGLY